MFRKGFEKTANLATAIAKLPSRIQLSGASRKIGVTPKSFKPQIPMAPKAPAPSIK